MKALVIGYGSIGKRNAINLTRLGNEVVLLRHTKAPKGKEFREYYDFDKVLAMEKPDFAVIASATPSHAAHACNLVDRGIPFLLEKPPALDCESTLSVQKAIDAKGFKRYDLAFNLRYYPPVRFIREYLSQLGKIYSVRVAAGSYLPAWRPSVDYRQTTSAKQELGGGVHIELVHEVDYILWFLGMPSQVTAHVTKVSNLDISSADLCVAILAYPDGSAVELHLDYLSHKNLRGCQIIAEAGTLEWNVTERKVKIFEPDKTEPRDLFCLATDYDFSQTYIDEIQHFLGVTQGVYSGLVSISHGVSIMRILDAMIASSQSRQWINISDTAQMTSET